MHALQGMEEQRRKAEWQALVCHLMGRVVWTGQLSEVANDFFAIVQQLWNKLKP